MAQLADSEQTIRRLAQRVERVDRERAYYADKLMAVTVGLASLCLCDPGADGAQRECPVHGDGVTFVEYVRRLENLAMAARDLRTQNVYALNPERPVWRKFADAVAALDGA